MIYMSNTAYANALYGGTGLVPDGKLLQNVIAVVTAQISLTTNKPAGEKVPSEDTWGASKTAHKDLTATHLGLPPGAIAITFVGETHGLDKDIATAGSIINNHNAADLIYYERKLHTGYGGVYANPLVATNTVREEDLTTSYGVAWGVNNFAVRPKPRDMVLAGYLVLCLASGDQAPARRIILLCGENHIGVFHQFEEIAAVAAPWLLKRKRLFHFVKSHQSDNRNQFGLKK